MRASQFPYVAVDGWPFIGADLALLFVAFRYGEPVWWLLALGLALLVFLVLLFQDPDREIPSLPLAIVAPVDGIVSKVSPTDRAYLDGEAIHIEIRASRFGAYTARSPTEGKVLSLSDQLSAGSKHLGARGLWVRTHEDDDVVLMFKGPQFARPVSFVRYGERIGQGQRCAFIRLATAAEVYLPIQSRVEVSVGDRVRAGSDIIATLVHR